MSNDLLFLVNELIKARTDGLDYKFDRKVTITGQEIKDELSAKIDDTRKELNAKIDATRDELSAKIERQDEKLDNFRNEINARFDKNEQDITELKISVARIEGTLEGMNYRIDGMQRQLDGMNYQISSLNTTIMIFLGALTLAATIIPLVKNWQKVKNFFRGIFAKPEQDTRIYGK